MVHLLSLVGRRSCVVMKEAGIARNGINDDFSAEGVLVSSGNDARRVHTKPFRQVRLHVDRTIRRHIAEPNIRSGHIFPFTLHTVVSLFMVVKRMRDTNKYQLDVRRILQLPGCLLQAWQSTIFNSSWKLLIFIEIDGAYLLNTAGQRKALRMR